MALKKSPSGTRVVSVSQFMSCLLHDKTLRSRKPLIWTQETKNNTFKTDFEESWVYCSHFINLHEHKLLDRKFLSAHIFRGAGILCANSQAGVDIAMAYLYRCKIIKRIRTGLILVQVKNDIKFTDVPDKNIFLGMDPHKFRIHEDE